MPLRPFIILLLCVTAAWLLTLTAINACTPVEPGTAQSPLLTTDLTRTQTSPSVNETIINYCGFTVSFNPDLHIPNWVAWNLTPEHTSGPIQRKKTFTADPAVCGCATLADYRNSGYDRGHMAPAGDMKWSQQAMDDCFNLTNIAPQTSALNTGQWNSLEQATRRWAMRDSTLTVICGPILTPSPVTLIGPTEVAVPQSFFKIIVAPHANPPRAIAFILPNNDTPPPYAQASVTIDEVEAITGHNFLSLLPDSIQQQLETQNHPQQWTKR